MNDICPLPFVSLEADSLGNCKVCCLSRDTIPDIDLRKNTLSEAFHSPYMQDLRAAFLRSEKPAGCSRCWDEEATGRKSKRMNSWTRLRHMIRDVRMEESTDGRLLFLDLKLGNICNLKCRICGSFSSSKWAAEEIAMYKNNQVARDNLERGRWPRESQAFWEDLEAMLSSVQYMEFTGGEPFLIDEHFELLQRAVDLGVSKQIEIHYNTNTTTVPQKGLELWPHFKLVEIALSIDDIGRRFEYQRHGAIWSKTQDNLKTFLALKKANDNIKLQLCLTVNSQNFYYIDEVLAWAPSQGFDYVHINLLHDAWYFSIRNLTQEAKDMIQAKYADYSGPYADDVQKLLQFMWSSEPTDGTKLVQILRSSDILRDQKFSDHHPEMARAIGYE
jgi:MoaA/NifB/PqqE/SkfB family radical SAM enzyme